LNIKLEEEIANLPGRRTKEIYSGIGLDQRGTGQINHRGLKLLGLDTFFTTGPDETRAAGPLKRVLKPRKPPAVIHRDFF